jgi:hypothetical protein
MAHRATISADFPTNGREVTWDSGGSHNFDTSGVKVFSREG